MFQEYKKILIPVDGSRESELSFRKAVEVAKRNKQPSSSLILSTQEPSRPLQVLRVALQMRLSVNPKR